MKIARRNLLRFSGAVAALALAGHLSLPASAQAQTTLTGVTYLPDSYEALTYGSNGFVEYLRENAPDTLQLDFYDSGQLLGVDEQLPALRAGNIDLMFHTTSYITRSVPILGITGLPQTTQALWENPDRLKIGSPLFELINEELAKDNLYMLSAGGGIFEPEYIWSTDANPIRSLEDVEGKKVRVVSFEATEALEEYGAAPVRIPSSELYLAMQRGTVDAAVANIDTIIGRSLQEQTGAVYKLPITGYSSAIFMLRDRWDALPPEAQQALQEAAQWYDENAVREARERIYPEVFWPAVEEAGVEIIDPDPETVQQFQDNTDEVTQAWFGEVGEEVGQRAVDLALGAGES
jgi:TRAP-type transport system periplasmic protein